MYERRQYVDGEVILTQGATADTFHLIAEGEVEIVGLSHDGVAVVFRTLGPGDFFGEEGLLTGRPRSASVIATGPVTTLVVGHEGFRTLAVAASVAGEPLPRVIAERVAERLEALEAAHGGQAAKQLSDPLT